MKTIASVTLLSLASGTCWSATLMPLDPSAAAYSLFGLNPPGGGDTRIELKEGTYNGLIGAAAIDELKLDAKVSKKGGGGVSFGATARFHSDIDKVDFDLSGVPGGGTAVFSGFDSQLEAVNTTVLNYMSYLNGLTPDQNFSSVIDDDFTFTTNQALTVLDFDAGVQADGSGDLWTLNGRPGENDAIVLRMRDEAIWEDGAPVILNNLDPRNVFWLSVDGYDFDLHKNDTAPFGGIIMSDNTNKNAVIVGDSDFTGQVFAANMVLGSGVVFDGIPEASVSCLFLTAFGGLLFVRRRDRPATA